MSRVKDKEDKNHRSMSLPTKFIPLGTEFVYSGMMLRCVPRGRCLPRTVCDGCALRGCFCDRIQCSKFDREDATSVWFVDISGEVREESRE